jgi:neutral ceramidase
MPISPPPYKVGVGKADITDTRRDLIFAGYSWEGQKSSGIADVPLFARAFYVEENLSTGARALCIVVIDAWACPEPIKSRVIKQLPANFKLNRDTLTISATHTHSAPGGYADYFLYNLTTGGQDKVLLKVIVDGIVAAITTAFNSRQPGHVYVAQGDLAGCGDNRSIKAYRATPEGQAADAYDKRTDREMTVLKFTQDTAGGETEIGLYSLFAIHPTSIGMFNDRISGDNKGWAAKLCEDAKPSGYVAAFANANAGDVSPNVSVASDWTVTTTRPEGRPGTHEAAANVAQMKVIGQQQAVKAIALAGGPMTELSGRLNAKSAHVDMSDVRRINGVVGKRTHKGALGASFAAGSKEDSIGILTVFDLEPFFSINFRPDINEGVNQAAYAAGYQQTRVVIGNNKAKDLKDAEDMGDLGLFLITLGTTKFNALKADDVAHSWAYPRAAQILFPATVDDDNPQSTPGARWEWNVPHSQNWPSSYVNGHGEKPVMFAVGISELKKNGRRPFLPQPLAPHVVQLQALSIGQLALAVLPNELTTVAGRRMKAMMRTVFGAAASHVALIGYANDYAFYITTKEEYDQQHYEGGSTLYGPHTCEAFLQEMKKVATALRDDASVTWGAAAPVKPLAIYFKT